MPDPALLHPPGSLPTILSKSRVGLWACLLATWIFVFSLAYMGMNSFSPASEESLGLVPLEGPSQGRKAMPTDGAERPTLPKPASKGKEAATSQNRHGQAGLAAPENENGLQKEFGIFTVKLQSAFRQVPLSFVPDRGQVDERVKFYGRSGSASFFFAKDEVVYSFLHREGKASLRKVSRSTPDGNSGRREEEKSQGHVVRLQFVGANPDPVIEGLQELPGKVNYFIGNDPTQWKRGLPTYGQVRYRELWPGIDLIYRGQDGKLKYEFLVKPGADPRQVYLAYRGIEGLSVNGAGDLILKTAWGELRDSRPVAYQEIEGRRVEVEAGFRVKGTGSMDTTLPPRGGAAHPTFIHGFEVESYNSAYPLILDPSLEYATFLGESGYNRGSGIAVDASGNAYVVGVTDSPYFPPTAGAFDTSWNGSFDAFVAKLSADGTTLLFSTFLGGSGGDSLGGSGGDSGSGIALDALGNAYIVGWTYSSDFPTTPGAFDRSHNGWYDTFVAKLSSDGSNLRYATFLGGNGGNWGSGIALDSLGNAYVTGRTYSSDFPTTVGAFDMSYNGDFDAFVAKLSSDGSALLYATFLGGSREDQGLGIALDASGNAYVAGATGSPDFPATVGAFDTSSNFQWGYSDAFVAKLSADGSGLLYATFLGGSSAESSSGIALDALGNAYVTGVTYSSDFPATDEAFDTSYNGEDAFVAKLSVDGSRLLYATFLGGSSGDSGSGIALDALGNAYVTGYTYSFDFPTTAGAFGPSFGGGIVVQLSSDGSALFYATFLGGGNCSGIALDSSGNAYVTGGTSSPDFPVTAGAFDTSFSGPATEDAFVAKLGLPSPPLLTFTVMKVGTGNGTVSSSPEGINCGTDCSESYIGGTSVTLIATPANGSTFAGWRDSCSGTGTCTLAVSRVKTATAIFVTPLTMSASALEGEVGMVYQGSLGIGGGLPPYMVSVVKGTLPPGLSPNSKGIVGTPTRAGNSSFKVQVTDDLDSLVSKEVSMRVFKAVSVVTKSLGKGKVGKKYGVTLRAARGRKPYAWSLAFGSLPEGLGLDPSTGKITGIPAASGRFDLTFQVTDALGGTASKILSLNIK